MTRKQITSILAELSYAINTKIRLDEVAGIYLTNDQFIYPDKNTRLKFYAPADDTTINLLLVYEGIEDSEGNFYYEKTDPKFFIPFSLIAGFQMANGLHMKDAFKMGMTI